MSEERKESPREKSFFRDSHPFWKDWARERKERWGSRRRRGKARQKENRQYRRDQGDLSFGRSGEGETGKLKFMFVITGSSPGQALMQIRIQYLLYGFPACGRPGALTKSNDGRKQLRTPL